MIDREILREQYFQFDEPVPYDLGDGKEVIVTPVKMKHSELFTTCAQILMIDKNSSPSVEIIQMPYLKFLTDVLFPQSGVYPLNLGTICAICLGMKNPQIILDKKGKPAIRDSELDITINCQQFDDISKIILYQNFVDYDDRYIDPDFKKAMRETDELRNKNIEIPNTERKMAILTSHTGIRRADIKEMTMREFSLVFAEVVGEVQYIATTSIAAFGGNDIDHWVYRKKRGAFDSYITDVDAYTRSMGGSSSIRTVTNDASYGNEMQSKFDNFLNKNNIGGT